jgi:hypothetical protein
MMKCSRALCAFSALAAAAAAPEEAASPAVHLTVAYCPTVFTGMGAVVKVAIRVAICGRELRLPGSRSARTPTQVDPKGGGAFSVVKKFALPSDLIGCPMTEVGDSPLIAR